MQILRSSSIQTVSILAGVLTLSLSLLSACDNSAKDAGKGATAAATATAPKDNPKPADPNPGDPTPAAATAEVPQDLEQGLMLVYSQFAMENGKAKPGAARLEFLTRKGGEWSTEVLEDKDSNVFHKAMVYRPDGAEPGIVTLGAMGAAVKLWRRSGDSWKAETLWKAKFGGKWDRMRDAEIADLYGDGKPALAVATHDQGVVSTIRADGGKFTITELGRKKDTFIHEIEIGDLNKDGTLEVYSTPSEPNKLEGGAQHGEVVRYVPKSGEGAVVVADLGNRHAKEILVDDVDGDGTDELYVAVEALTAGKDGAEIKEPVEIRRYDADTPKDKGVVVAKLNDRLCRFLTAGDVDGDGKKELIAAAFSSGIWLLRPGKDPKGEWSSESIDRDSGGFEHSAILLDLDKNGTDELYVAADKQGEVRRYAWVRGRAKREVIHKLAKPGQMITWNITAVPVSMLAK